MNYYVIVLDFYLTRERERESRWEGDNSIILQAVSLKPINVFYPIKAHLSDITV